MGVSRRGVSACGRGGDSNSYYTSMHEFCENPIVVSVIRTGWHRCAAQRRSGTVHSEFPAHDVLVTFCMRTPRVQRHPIITYAFALLSSSRCPRRPPPLFQLSVRDGREVFEHQMKPSVGARHSSDRCVWLVPECAVHLGEYNLRCCTCRRLLTIAFCAKRSIRHQGSSAPAALSKPDASTRRAQSCSQRVSRTNRVGRRRVP